METAEQIKNPVFSESAVPENPQPDNAPDETDLIAEITELWRIHDDYTASMRHQSQNLRSLRAELGKKLAEMKALLARPGRTGQWSSWLKQREISRATADRLVVKHERSLHPDSNCLTESISEPTEEEIQRLFAKIAPKLRRVLRTPTSAYRFVDLLSESLALDRRFTEEGILVLKPAAHSEPVRPRNSPVETSLQEL